MKNLFLAATILFSANFANALNIICASNEEGLFGWNIVEEETVLKFKLDEECQTKIVKCDAKNTRSEGWYAITENKKDLEMNCLSRTGLRLLAQPETSTGKYVCENNSVFQVTFAKELITYDNCAQ